jgi:hypothetical protein
MRPKPVTLSGSHSSQASFLLGLFVALLSFTGLATPGPKVEGSSKTLEPGWPPPAREQRPWTYWWWMGSAVDTTNLTRDLERFRAAGFGGVHIIPIYGAKGWETNFIHYLSPRWMEMLKHTVAEADRLDLGVDMTTGTGWCFGGPEVTDLEANASLVTKVYDLAIKAALEASFRDSPQALVGFRSDAPPGWTNLLPAIQGDGRVTWRPDEGSWKVYAIAQKPSGQKVKRASPGSEGYMLNPFYEQAMRSYLTRFDKAFTRYSGTRPRAMYHDSYEYRSEWSPNLLQRFLELRGYRLESELPDFLARDGGEKTARLKYDYRLTLSDLMVEDVFPVWQVWSRQHGFLTRNEAHGSPANLLDLYALADMPETEMFYKDRNRLISKFASSAAHVSGKRLVSSETGTWLKEHFTETLADMKYLVDDLFLSGVNHVFYHGSCYSPDEAPWPGWLFYASYEMNSRNPIWHDVPAVNAYISRCQAVLQSGVPDNDILLYWPVHDLWQDSAGMARTLTVHARDWFEAQPIGKIAERLWDQGYCFDYVSDRQLLKTRIEQGRLRTEGGDYQVILVPTCKLMPVETLRHLLALAEQGATVLFEGGVPSDVPGLSRLQQARAEFQAITNRLHFTRGTGEGFFQAPVGKGRVLTGNPERGLENCGVGQERMVEHSGLCFIRRANASGRSYFIVNRGGMPFTGWLPLSVSAPAVGILDPMTGKTGMAEVRGRPERQTEVRLRLEPGQSLFCQTLSSNSAPAPAWFYREPSDLAYPLRGPWEVTFTRGGPVLPSPKNLSGLKSWGEFDDEAAQIFAGTAIYRTRFDSPNGARQEWFLDLGAVAQSARIRLNGQDYGTLLCAPFRVLVGELKTTQNELEVEVTSVAANRIRDLDRRGVGWKYFQDINFVNLSYKPFDASAWPVVDCGLLGPVTLVPAKEPK